MEKSLSKPIEQKQFKDSNFYMSKKLESVGKQQITKTNQAQVLQKLPEIVPLQQTLNLFDQYIYVLKSKILKRKIILFILNIMLTLIALVFAICFIVWGSSTDQSQSSSKIQEIFNTQFSLVTLLLIVIIGVLSAIFSIIIIKGKVIMLHCYWITCLLFLVIFSIVGASAFSLTSMDCEQPSSYILQKIKTISNSGSNLFCSENCPCNRNQSIVANSSATQYGQVQDCPGWDQTLYSSFLSTIEQNLKCSGWCSVNPKAYFTFYQGTQIPDNLSQISCFNSIIANIESDTAYLRLFCVILCGMLVIVIFYTNYYIFMEKQDENREAKKVKRKIKETQQKMEDELKTSKRMLS